MKKRAIQILAMTLCLILCLQGVLATGVFSLQVDAATMTVPSKVSNMNDLRSAAFPHGNYVTCFQGRKFLGYYQAITSSMASSYASSMVSNGYTQIKTGTVNNITYWHYTHSNGGVAFLVYDGKTMYLTTDDRSVTSAYTPRGSYTKITDVTLGIQSLDYSHGELGDGNGLCNIWTLEDGSYLILDGGYEYDAERLYNYLYDNNKRADGKILIHAWYFTHGHGDHYGAFQQFTLTHSKDVTLEYVIASAAADADLLNADLLNRMKAYPGSKLVRPHTGETFQMPGLKMDILYTCEDLYMYNGAISADNDSSTVSRVTVGGQTILYTGDASANACARLNAMYGTGLKSTFLQINHHGYGGGTSAFYNNVTPSYILWTSSQFGTERRTGSKIYQWIGGETWRQANLVAFGHVGNDYNKVFAADGPVELMTFPYNGDRASLPTYRAYDEVKIKDADTVFSENFSTYKAGSYTASEIRMMLGWNASGTTGVTFNITSDGKLRIASAVQNPEKQYNFTTGVGTPAMNYGGDLFLTLANMSHFMDGRTVIEYEMTYNESIVPAAFGAAFRVRNEKATGAYWYEPTMQVNGTFDHRLRYNTNWQYLSPIVTESEIPFNSLTTNYITDPNGKWLYDGYLVTDRFSNLSDEDGDGVYTSTMTKDDNTIFGSTDKYKIVIDPANGAEVYVNGTQIASTDVDDAWRESIFENVFGSVFGLRVMPGIDVTLDDIKVYRENSGIYDEKMPELVITEIAPGGANKNARNEFIEVMNNSTQPINIYKYCIVRDAMIGKDAKANDGTAGTPVYHTTTEDQIAWIKPGATTWTPVNNANNAVTHVNPPLEEGVLQPGEVAVLWIPTNTARNTSSSNYVCTIDMFREYMGLGEDVKVFSCYNNYDFSLTNNSCWIRYGIGYADVDYTTGDMSSERHLNRLVSYVEHISFADGMSTTMIGSEMFTQVYPKAHYSAYGSIQYYYPANNYARHGKLLSAVAGVHTVGVALPEQLRYDVTVTVNGKTVEVDAPTLDLTPYIANTGADLTVVLTGADGMTTRTTETTVAVSDGMTIEIFENKEVGKNVLYSQNFDGITAFSHTFTDATASSYYNYTFKYEDLLGWDQMTPTDGSEFEVTADGKLRIYNPYYMTLERPVGTTTVHETLNYDYQIEIGDFSEMVGNRVVLEYDFQYNDRGTTATAAAVFSFGKHIDPKSYCFAPALTVQGFYQPRIGTVFGAGGGYVHDQIRPEWIPYSKTTTGYNYPYGGTTNHYNIFGGTNHVKIEIDPYNGITTYVNGVAISLVQNTAAWETLYNKHIGELLGLSVAPGVEVVLDNIEVYTEESRPELLITEVGSAMGMYEYIEVYNNSNRDLDIYNYTLMRNTNLASGGGSGAYLGVGASWSAPIRWTNDNIATIKRGTHTYTAEKSGQSVTLTNPESGIIKPGEVAVLWIPSNTTMDDTTSSPTTETLEMFMNNYGLTDASKVFAAYNNNNISLWDDANIAYGIGYAGVDYTTHNAYAMNELESYVYMNQSATSIYGNTETAVTVTRDSLGSGEFTYNHNNGVKRGSFHSFTAKVNSCGVALSAQERICEVTIGAKKFNVPLRVQLGDLMERLDLNTLYGGSIRTSVPTGMRWMTSVDAKAYADMKDWMQYGVITNVEIGTIMIRTEDLGDNALTLDLVDGEKCHSVLATDTAWFEETPTVEKGYSESLVGTHIFAGSVANIKQENYTVKYSAVGYLSVTWGDGSVETIYGGYSEEAHSRTVAEVAYMALTDANNGLSAAELEVIASFAAYYEG